MTEPRPPSEELIRQLSDYDLRVGELALALRDIVLGEAPTADERIFRSYALVFWYSFTGRLSDSFCYIGMYTKHVNLGFYRGADLEDPDGVLVGDGKQLRHIKIQRPEDLKNPSMRKLIRGAMKHSKLIEKEKQLAARSKKPVRRASKRRPSK